MPGAIMITVSDVTAPVPRPRFSLRGKARIRTASTARSSRLDRIAIILLAVITVASVVGPMVAPYAPDNPVGIPFTPAGHSGFLLGTDEVGRDIFSRILVGLRASWFATLGIVFTIGLVGVAAGTVAGLAGGIVDTILMRITDFFLALPSVVVAIVIVAAIGGSLFHAALALVLVSWPYYARLARSEVRGIAARPHVEAARLSGISRRRLALRHVLPGVVPIVIVSMSMDLGGMTIALSLLSFLGLGTAPPAPELGSMVANGLTYVLSNWWVPVMPALAVFVIAVIANFAGDGVRDLVGER
jgi:peptide/nickel transport system permease protein